MNETSKCRQMRLERGDFEKYLFGAGIDIGAGHDPLMTPYGTVRPWDLSDGDAELLPNVPDNSYDFVYSSHSLEHMPSVERALTNWIRVLKPNGFLYLVVPDYILYEKMMWPSVFNTDHLHSFSFLVTRPMTGRANHYHMQNDLFPLLQSLGATVLRTEVETLHFDFNKGAYDQTRNDALSQISLVAQKSR